MENQLKIPSIPHLVHIETTYWCNQNCRFCYNPRRNDHIEQAVIHKIVQSIYDSWIPHVYLIGGEPSGLGTEVLNGYIDLLSERSSVTIVTNGQIYLDGLSDKLACIGVPIHGDEATHDYLANKKGSFRKTVSSIKKYVERGFDVRCIPVLTRQNFDQISQIVCLAKNLGMESVFVDRYEDGGIGSNNNDNLKPSTEEFKIALGQMIAARDEYNIPVGWGTAIPFCLDERLTNYNMWADCGAGVTFAAINPKGNVRACNQSEIVYGNVLTDPLEQIWHRPALEEFRNLSWVTKPCTGCKVLTDCLCGCKVDAHYSDGYSVDYAVRGNETPPYPIIPLGESKETEVPEKLRNFRLNRYVRLNTAHKEPYLVTRYQTIELDETAIRMTTQILNGITTEKMLIDLNFEQIEIDDIRKFVSQMVLVGALDITEE